jgi:hypothetical protein
MSEVDLRDLLLMLDPKARGDLRRVLIRDQADPDGAATLAGVSMTELVDRVATPDDVAVERKLRRSRPVRWP